jgi:hypothetical protein
MDRGVKHVAATRFINLIHPHGLQVRILSLNSPNYPIIKTGQLPPLSILFKHGLIPIF